MTPAREAAAPPPLRRHPEARLYGPDGGEVAPPEAAPNDGWIDAGPPAERLARWLAALEAGRGAGIAPAGASGPAPTMPAAAAGRLWLASSGSTGAPRVILRRPDSWRASFAVNARLFALGPGRRLGLLGGLESSLTLYAAAEALSLGATCHLCTGLRPDRAAARLRAAHVDILYATPTQLRQLAESPPLPALRHVLVGGGFLDAATRAAARATFPNAEIRVFYGAVETSFITLAGPGATPGEVGPAYPGVRLELRGPDGTAVPAGTPGEVFVSSPYLAEAEVLDGTARPLGAPISAGEVGRLDPEGNLVLLGRAARMFTVADRNLYPEALEALILAQPGVQHAAVLPRPDARRGQVPVALFAGTAAPEDLARACRAVFGPALAPRDWQRLTDFPLLPGGKPDLVALARLAGAASPAGGRA